MPEPALEPDWVYAEDPPECPQGHGFMEFDDVKNEWFCPFVVKEGHGEGEDEVEPELCEETVYIQTEPDVDDLEDGE